MGVSQNQRLRKAAAKAAKRKVIVATKQAQERRELLISKPRHIDFAHSPYRRCFMSDDSAAKGTQTVVVARDLSSGRVAFVVFLVDRLCLGVKDAIFRVGSAIDLEEVVETLEAVAKVEDIDAPTARRLLHDAVAYAAANGIPPIPAYEEMAAIFGDTPLGDRSFEFGSEGKPLYMPGPYDSPRTIKRVMDALERHLGPDGFDYISPLDAVRDEDDDEDLDFEIEDDGQTIEGEVTAVEETELSFDGEAASEGIAKAD